MAETAVQNPFTSPLRVNVARILAKTVTNYLKDPEHRKAFEAWYREKYGKEYVWKTLSDLQREKEACEHAQPLE